MQFGRFLRRMTLDEKSRAIDSGKRVENDRDLALWLARHFLQASICSTADTRRSDKDKTTNRMCKAFDLNEQ